jgi:hypothetical protein
MFPVFIGRKLRGITFPEEQTNFRIVSWFLFIIERKAVIFALEM